MTKKKLCGWATSMLMCDRMVIKNSDNFQETSEAIEASHEHMMPMVFNDKDRASEAVNVKNIVDDYIELSDSPNIAQLRQILEICGFSFGGEDDRPVE